MDPNVTLREMRELVKRVLHDYEDEDGNGVDQDDAASLASHVETLDAWLSRGNFLPEKWQKAIDEDLYTAVYRILADNDSRCMDDVDDRKALAGALVRGLQRR